MVKRSLSGIYHSVNKDHLHRYNNRHLEDGERTIAAIKGSEGKRLQYREPVTDVE